MVMRFLLSAVLLTFSCMVHAAPRLRKISAAGAADGAVKIDGRLDDAAWGQVPWYSDFVLLREVDKQPRQQTRFKVLADSNYLYFAIEALETQTAKLRQEVTERDGKVYRDDCLEFFIAPAARSGEYFYFAVNPRGTVLDMHVIQNGHLKIPDFNSYALKCRTSVAEDRWTVEMAVPWHELNMRSYQGQMGFNLVRERCAGNGEISSFQPVTRDLHMMENLGELRLPEIDFAPFRWEWKPFYNIRTAAGKDGEIFLHISTYLINRTGKMRFAALHAAVGNGEKISRTVMLDLDQGREINLSLPVGKNAGSQPVRLWLTERGTNRNLGCWQEICNADYTPIELALAEPHYRASFFAFDKIEKIAGRITLNLPAAQIPEQLSLTLSDQQNRIVAQKNIPGGHSADFELPVSGLAQGEYILKTVAGNFTHTQTVTVLPEQKGTVSLTKNRSILLDGKPFVPIGWISLEPHGCQTAASNGWNVTLDYRFSSWSDSQRQRFLDQLHQYNIKAVVYCYPDSKMLSAERWRQPLSAAESQAIGEFVKRWSKHPALLGWYLSDEPEGAGALPARLEAVAEACRKADPYHPTILLNCTVNGIVKYAGISDISMPDPYPGFIAGGNAAKEMNSVTTYMEAARQGKGAEQVLWCTPQAFSWADFGRGGQRAPEFDEMRNMHYQSVLSGASGWFYYSWYWGAQFHPQIDYAVRYLAREVKILRQLHSNPDKLRKISGLPAGVIGGRCRLDSGEWTILVNNDVAEKSVCLPASGAFYYVLGSDRQLAGKGGRLEIKLKKYQTLIFCDQELSAEAAALRIEDFKQAAALEKQRRRKAGNLLLPEKKCRFTATKNARGKYAHELYLNNGDIHVPGYQPLQRQDTLEISWPRPQQISSVKIYGSRNFNITVNHCEKGQMRRLGSLGEEQEAVFPAITADRIILKLQVPDNIPLSEVFINEIEIY